MKKDKQLTDIKRRGTCKIVCVLLFLLISVIGICVPFTNPFSLINNLFFHFSKPSFL